MYIINLTPQLPTHRPGGPLPRPLIASLPDVTLTRAKQATMKKEAEEAGFHMVVKTVDREGVTRV